MINYIVFYGTLMRKCGCMGAGLAGVHYIKEVEISGDLFNVGAFPALVMGEGRVKAELYKFNEGWEDDALERFDGIEGYYGDKEGDMYTRTVVNIPEVGLAWVYTWNEEIEGMEKIEDGDWYNFRG